MSKQEYPYGSRRERNEREGNQKWASSSPPPSSSSLSFLLKVRTEDRFIIEMTSSWLVMILYVANRRRLYKLPLKYKTFKRAMTEDVVSSRETSTAVRYAYCSCFWKMTWSFEGVVRSAIIRDTKIGKGNERTKGRKTYIVQVLSCYLCAGLMMRIFYT